ncbi:MAG: S8 family serine peptidase [Ardenticatenales bacterium]
MAHPTPLPSLTGLRRRVAIAAAAAALVCFAPRPASLARPIEPARHAAVDPGLAARVAAGRDVPALALLRVQADMSGAAHLADKRARGRFVYNRLRATADATQGPLRGLLARRGLPFTPYFIVNAVAFDADGPTLAAVAAMDDVASIVPLVTFGWGGPTDGVVAPVGDDAPSGDDAPIGDDAPVGDAASPSGAADVAAAERNIRAINADKVWRQGFLGAGATIAIIDTGVNARHPALSAAYRGKDEGDDYNWLDPVAGQGAPVDVNDHGTHVAGIALGKQGSREIGVAPEAQWIACRIFAQDRGTTKAILDCLQWALAPTKLDGSDPRPDRAPDIINASWGTFGRLFCDNPFPGEGAIHNLVAAGILFVAAAGNDGPRCGSVCPPGSLADAFTVGNYDDENRRMASTSSRGPFVAGVVERIKPDVAAPGENINSSVGTSQYDIKAGTSMAAPHVSGAAALLLSVRPALAGHPDQIRSLLETTAKAINADQCGPSGARDFNNSAGHGVIDVAAAADTALGLPTATPEPSTPIPSASPTVEPSASPSAVPTARPSARPSATQVGEATPTNGPTRRPSATAAATPSAPASPSPRIFLPWTERLVLAPR